MAGKRAALAATVMVVSLAISARAQVQVGENTSLNMTGNLSFGYTGDYSNVYGSDHGLTPGGNADLRGSYYDPGFLSFEVQPFYNQSRLNSTYQSIFQSGGVNSSASMFSGSNFPGFVSFSKILNSEGGYNLPGVGNLTTRGNSDNFALGWGIRIPDYPHVSFQFTDGDNTSSLYGTDANSSFHSKIAGVTASHTLAGFNLNGGYSYNTVNTLTPEILTAEPPLTTDMSSSSLNFGVGHKLPFNGAFSAGASRTGINSESSFGNFNGTIDTVSSGVDFAPIHNLNVGVNGQYTNNLEGTLYQPLITAGAVPAALLNYSTHSLDINSHASYALPNQHLNLAFNDDHRQQTVVGTPLSANTLYEMVTYGNTLLGGFLNATGGVTETTLSLSTRSSSLGELGTVSYTRKVEGWNVNGSFSYSRNTQTVLIGYTSSGHAYSAGIGRKLSPHSYWSVNAIEAKTTFNDSSGSSSFSQSYTTAISLNHFSLSGSYSKADGTSILTPTGLAPVSNPTPIPTPLQAILFNGKSYSFGASTSPRYGLILSGIYSKTNSSTAAASAASWNETEQLNTTLQYKVRQVWITGGYLKLRQGLSITGQPPSSDSSFYVGITRWFNFF